MSQAMATPKATNEKTRLTAGFVQALKVFKYRNRFDLFVIQVSKAFRSEHFCNDFAGCNADNHETYHVGIST